MNEKPTTEQYLEAAMAQYQKVDSIEIDEEKPEVRTTKDADHGWVKAWVKVEDKDARD